jgi:nitroimidazol reductase NimA-like FMN-containing flavoprotein (pyridoxamine 5'-phosphate oxidase superfamily)
MNTALTDRRLQVLDRHACLRLLGTEQVGRLAISMPAEGPLVVPVNYTLAGDAVQFRSGYGSKLRRLPSRSVSFQVDSIDDASQTGWSVLVRGRAREIRERDATPPLPEPWTHDDKPYLIRLEIRSVTGRRISTR